MLSKLPNNIDKVNQEDLNKEILRAGAIAELDAISFYEQMAAMTKDENLKKVLLDVAKEEKEHVGEFQSMLFERDKEQQEEYKEGEEEARQLSEE